VIAQLAIESATRSVPPSWRLEPFRRVAWERGVRNAQLSDQALSLSSTGRLYERTDETDRQFGSEQSARNAWVVRPGDLVVNPMWLFGGAIGVSDRRGAVSPDYRVYALSPRLHPRFVHHLLRSSPYRDQYRLYMRAETTFDRRITKDDFHQMPVVIPPLAMQHAIAAYLDAETARIDELVGHRREQITLLREAVEARRSATILSSLDPVSGAGRVPDTWERPLLGVLVELHREIDLPSHDRQPGAVPVVSSGGISGMHSVAACHGPGVVTGRYGTIGDVYYVEGPYWPLNTTLYVSDFRGNHPRWVYHLLAALPLNIDAEKSAVTGINRNVVGQLRSVRPPLPDQRRIADELDECEHAASEASKALARQVDLLVERRQALITAAVTGQLQISGSPPE